jgi:hypothetical protein
VLDHLLARDELAAARPTRPFELLLGREQRLGADFVEVVLGDVVEQLEFWLDRRGSSSASFRNASSDVASAASSGISSSAKPTSESDSPAMISAEGDI